MPTHQHHLHHTIISLHHHRLSTTSHIISYDHHHIANSSNHPRHNSTPQTPRVHSLNIYNSHHGLPTTESHPHLKYHGNTDPCKFLMCYEAAIASARGDEATLAKFFIISLEDAAAN
jgi:hypothetical protein